MYNSATDTQVQNFDTHVAKYLKEFKIIRECKIAANVFPCTFLTVLDIA